MLSFPTFKRGRCRRAIIAELSAAGPVGIASGELAARVYAGDKDGGPEWGDGCVRVVIHRMRAEVERQGWRIVGARQTGVYRLEMAPCS